MISVQILNPHSHNKISLRHAERMVRLRRAKWARGTGGQAIWLIHEWEQKRAGYEAGALSQARLHEIAGIPVVAAGRLLGMGNRSAGPAYRG